MKQPIVRLTQALSLFLLAILIAGCGDHDTSTPEKALIGHWVMHSGKTHYYFDGSSFILDEKDEKDPRPSVSYTVLESNNKVGWIKIRLNIPDFLTYEKKMASLTHEKMIVFDANRKSLTDNAQIMGVWMAPDELVYVDAKKKP
jgi:hypothetical protein